MIVYVNNSYRSLYKAMTGKEYEPGSPNLTWNMLLDKLITRSSYIDDIAADLIHVRYYVAYNPSNEKLYDVFFSICTIQMEQDIRIKPVAKFNIPFVVENDFNTIKEKIDNNFKSDGIDIANIYFFDLGRVNGFSDNNINVFIPVSEGYGIDDSNRTFSMNVEFSSYFGTYKMESAYGSNVISNTILKEVEDKQKAITNIALNLIKNYILNLIMAEDLNKNCEPDNVIY